MGNFWDYNVWSTVSVLAVLLLGLLAANALKKNIRFLRESLVPTSVLAGVLLLVISTIYEAISGTSLFETGLFGQNGTFQLEVVTYHCLALGFVATSFRPSTRKFDKKRGAEIFNTGVTTVSTYLIQAVLGMGITVLLALFVKDLYPASGLLLPFGYGQGSGQAMNYGSIYEADGFVGGKSFGLTVAVGTACRDDEVVRTVGNVDAVCRIEDIGRKFVKGDFVGTVTLCRIIQQTFCGNGDHTRIHTVVGRESDGNAEFAVAVDEFLRPVERVNDEHACVV